MKKFFMMLPLMVALVTMVGCKKTTTTDPTDDPKTPTEDYKENDPYYNTFNVAGCGIFGEEPVLIPGTETQKQTSEGTVTVQLGYCDFYAWDGNLTFNENQGAFSGKGLLIEGVATIYFVTSPEEIAGVYLVPSCGFRVQSTTTPTEGAIVPGTIDAATYGDWIKYQMFNGKEPDQEKIFSKTAGALFSQSDIPNQTEEYAYGIYRGAINKMVINVDNSGKVTSWGADVNWSNMTSTERCYGFHFTTVDTTKTMTEPYDYRSVNRKFHEDVLNAAPQAPAKDAVVKLPALRRPYPAIKK